MVTKGLNKITQNETQDLQLVDNFCKSWERSKRDRFGQLQRKKQTFEKKRIVIVVREIKQKYL